MRHVNTVNRRTQPVYDPLPVRYPNPATERLFEFWRNNNPRNVMVPYPLEYEEEVYYQCDRWQSVNYPCLDYVLSINFGQPITDEFDRFVILNGMGIKAMKLATSVLGFLESRLGIEKEVAWQPWDDEQKKCTGCRTCSRADHVAAVDNVVRSLKRVWRTIWWDIMSS
ncbi:hypothetical protein ONS95_011134 [Cadophora gregata]|uniref:uncharacterized protein n=1 Tax=Cadophora gregata TaxID=51156 RepID=UPI0026DCAA47|nr:uncharacterized protein ONS95_011134 [Cadophora gregata]KAK0119699.1 hypothetical protein ONS95_011134 [Cadophora gregata]